VDTKTWCAVWFVIGWLFGAKLWNLIKAKTGI
jgi:hypothetical protein